MLHPVGRLPRGVYWRRRAMLLAAVALTVVLTKGVLLSGDDSRAATRPSPGGRPPPTQPGPGEPTVGPSRSTGPAPASTRPSSSAARPSTPAPRPSVARSTAPPSRPPAPASGPPAPTRAAPTSARPTASSAKPSRRPAAHQPTPSRAVAPAADCTGRDLHLFVGTVADSYRAGAVSDLALSVANLSDRSCRAQLGAKVQEALVYHGSHRLWSSNDCYAGSESRVVTLRPGQLTRLVIRWSGDTSTPGCAGHRRPVPAGHYTVVGRVDGLAGRGRIVLR